MADDRLRDVETTTSTAEKLPPPDSGQPGSQPVVGASPPSGFAGLAKRISAWTTNSLLTLLVLVAGVGFGRQVLKWWAADASPSGDSRFAPPNDALGDPMQLHTLQFGDLSWALGRQSIRGDRQHAMEQARAACRESLATRPPTVVAPPAANGGGASGATTVGRFAPNDEKFLDFLSHSKPVVEDPGKWRVYEYQGAFPMAVGLARAADAAPEPPTNTPPSLAQSGYRVVVWVLAVPAGNGEWTLWTFQPEGPPAGSVTGAAEIPVPPGGHRGLSLQTAGGGLIAFGGPCRPEEWKRFYDDWFRSQDWRSATGWRPADGAWCARFTSDAGGAVDVRFGPDGRGGLSGLFMVTRPAAR